MVYMFSTRAEETMSVDELLPAWRLAHAEKAGSIPSLLAEAAPGSQQHTRRAKEQHTSTHEQ